MELALDHRTLFRLWSLQLNCIKHPEKSPFIWALADASHSGHARAMPSLTTSNFQSSWFISLSFPSLSRLGGYTIAQNCPWLFNTKCRLQRSFSSSGIFRPTEEPRNRSDPPSRVEWLGSYGKTKLMSLKIPEALAFNGLDVISLSALAPARFRNYLMEGSGGM